MAARKRTPSRRKRSADAAPRRRAARSGAKLDFEGLRRVALALPGVVEGTSYGTPAFRVRKKLIARLWEDLETVVIRVDWDQRDTLLETDPDAFFLTDHYRDHPWVCVCLSSVQPDALGEVLRAAWRREASKQQLSEVGELDRS